MAPFARRTARRTLLLASATVLTAVAATACGTGADDGDGGRTQVRIAYQAIPNADLVVKNRKLLEKALPDADVKWVKFDSGADVNTAVIAGSVDLGLAGSSAVAKGLSQPLNIPYKVLWIHDVIGDNEALVARKGIGSVKALKGRKVAAPFGSTTHYSLLAALEEAGLEQSDVKLVDLQPQDALAAWQRGDIDAAYVWTPTLSELAKDGTVLVTSREIAEQGRPTADLGVVTTAFADQHPDVVDAWLAAENQAVRLARKSPDEAAAAIGAELGLSPKEAKEQLGQLVLLTAEEQAGADHLGAPGTPGALAGSLHDAARFLKSQKAVDAVPARSVFEKALAVEELARVTG
ncbi:taurine ABC transporter substrate-binding protein [Streptomyces sp. CO7]